MTLNLKVAFWLYWTFLYHLACCVVFYMLVSIKRSWCDGLTPPGQLPQVRFSLWLGRTRTRTNVGPTNMSLTPITNEWHFKVNSLLSIPKISWRSLTFWIKSVGSTLKFIYLNPILRVQSFHRSFSSMPSMTPGPANKHEASICSKKDSTWVCLITVWLNTTAVRPPPSAPREENFCFVVRFKQTAPLCDPTAWERCAR